MKLTARFLEVIGYGHLAKNSSLPVGGLLVLHLLVRACREVSVIGGVGRPVGQWLDHFLIVRVVDGWVGGRLLQVSCRQFVVLDAIHSNGLAAVANRRRTVLLILLLALVVL